MVNFNYFCYYNYTDTNTTSIIIIDIFSWLSLQLLLGVDCEKLSSASMRDYINEYVSRYDLLHATTARSPTSSTWAPTSRYSTPNKKIANNDDDEDDGEDNDDSNRYRINGNIHACSTSDSESEDDDDDCDREDDYSYDDDGDDDEGQDNYRPCGQQKESTKTNVPNKKVEKTLKMKNLQKEFNSLVGELRSFKDGKFNDLTDKGINSTASTYII